VPENIGETSWLQRIPGMIAEPKVAASVARVFEQKAKSFKLKGNNFSLLFER
jgi:hypothetical protein